MGGPVTILSLGTQMRQVINWPENFGGAWVAGPTCLSEFIQEVFHRAERSYAQFCSLPSTA
jgi:hypothetical protein